MSAVPLRVATFNIHHGTGSDMVHSLERIASVIESLDADIVALQEVDSSFGERSRFADQASILGEQLGMAARFDANLDLDPRPGSSFRRRYGLALLSRHEVTSLEHVQLPTPASAEKRGAQVATLTIHGRQVRVINTHLSTAPHALRAEQMASLYEHIDGHAPCLVLGDFNTPSFNPRTYRAVRTLLRDTWAWAPRRSVVRGGNIPARADAAAARERHGLWGRLVSLVRAWRTRFGGRTNPVRPVRLRRIDYILASRGFTPVASYVVTTVASDHHPVIADLVLEA